MLKAYHVYTNISVDDGPFIEYWRRGYGLTEDDLPKTVVTQFSFEEALHGKPPTPAIKPGETFFRKRPYVEIEYYWSRVDRYYNFNHITIERRYEEWDDITPECLMKEFSVEECIQYLKERGVATCPLLSKGE